MLVHIFGATSSPSCAGFCLKQTALDYGKLYNTFMIVNENFYVDDCVVSVGTKPHAVMVVEQLTSLLAKGGFRLTKWLANNKIVLETIPGSERFKFLPKLDLNSTSNDRVLGIKWNFEADVFTFSVNLPKSTLMSPRSILSIIFPSLTHWDSLLRSCCLPNSFFRSYVGKVSVGTILSRNRTALVRNAG